MTQPVKQGILLHRNPYESSILARILPGMARGLITQRRKGAKTQRIHSVLATLRLCDFALKSSFVRRLREIHGSIPLVAAMLRCALSLVAANPLKWISMNHLHSNRSFPSQAQSKLIKPNQVIFLIALSITPSLQYSTDPPWFSCFADQDEPSGLVK
jgi:hypothetical protein